MNKSMNNRIDHDLLSVQEARILAENAKSAQKAMSNLSQEKLDTIVMHIAKSMERHVKDLANLSCNETEYGNAEDKARKNQFVCRFLAESLRKMPCVGIIAEDAAAKTKDIGVPIGVIAALPPATSPVSTTIYKALIAIKSGNAIVFSPHPRAKNAICKTVKLIIDAGVEAGLPPGAVSCLSYLSKNGTEQLMCHPLVDAILITGVPKMLEKAQSTGKLVIYGGTGGGPVFVERTANIAKAAKDIISSRTFDYGIVSAAEQAIVADAPIAEALRQELKKCGAYFMTDEESKLLIKLFRPEICSETVGKSAEHLAKRAGFTVPPGTTTLISEQKYATPDNPYAREKLCPVLAFYVEDNWQSACEKCIELLISEGRSHTLSLHSADESIIREFALQKPVSRILVNTPATFGGMGATTNLFPAMTLGSGLRTDNISPMNLIRIRKVGYGVRELDERGLASERAGPDIAAIRQELLAELAEQDKNRR